MNSEGLWPKRSDVFPKVVLIIVGLLISGLILMASPQGGTQGTGTGNAGKVPSILKGKDSILIRGTVVAVSQETVGEAGGPSVDLMLLKIENILSGKDPGRYVRADFNHSSSVKIDPERARTQRQLLFSLRAGKTMKIHLRPPVEGVECRWAIPSPPKAGEEVGILAPVMIPIGDAKGYPDINKLPCYAFELQDFEQVASPPENR